MGGFADDIDSNLSEQENRPKTEVHESMLQEQQRIHQEQQKENENHMRMMRALFQQRAPGLNDFRTHNFSNDPRTRRSNTTNPDTVPHHASASLSELHAFRPSESPKKNIPAAEQQRIELWEKYITDVSDTKHSYEAFFEQFDPTFTIQIDFLEDINEFQSDNYEYILERAKQKMRQQVESRGEELIQKDKSRFSKEIEERKVLENDIVEIDNQIGKIQESSRDIENALSIQDPNLERDRRVVYETYKDLKQPIKNYLRKNEISNGGNDQLLKGMLQDILNATRYETEENYLDEVEALFKHSGHEKWIKHLRLQNAVCYLDQETSSERIQDSISKLSTNYKYDDLDLVHCIYSADTLCKYSLAKFYYYNGDFSVENIDKLYGLQFDESVFNGNIIKDDNLKIVKKIILMNPSPPQEAVIEECQKLRIPVTDETQELHIKEPYREISTSRNSENVKSSNVDNTTRDVKRRTSNSPFNSYQWCIHVHSKGGCKCSWCKHKVNKYCTIKGCSFCHDIEEHQKHCKYGSTGLFKLRDKKTCSRCVEAKRDNEKDFKRK